MLTIDQLTIFCKNKGFIFQNSEIYGGLSGFFDYGPLGVELKNNIKREWWKTFVQSRSEVVGIDGSIISHPKVWEASGHVSSFIENIVICKKCGNKNKIDKHEIGKVKCDKCGGEYENEGEFNPMFTTKVGSLKKDSLIAYLRPETAQMIFTNFKLVTETSRLKLPFGIAQIGKAFRNEISPRDFIFRLREFEQMEIEYFINPKEVKSCPYLKEIKTLKVNFIDKNSQKSNKPHKEITIKDLAKTIKLPWLSYWLSNQYKFFLNLGIKKENLRIREHKKEELAHYANACFDIEYKFPFGWKELQGMADRKQFDLSQHEKFSKKDLSIFDENEKKKILPYVAAEPSQGVERAFLAFIYDAYNDDKKRGNIVLNLNPKLAPVKIGIFPLVNKLNNEAKEIYDLLKKKFTCIYDASGSIGRRYARADEIGIPYCITIDFECKNNKDVTIRDLLTTNQTRVKLSDLKETLNKLLNQEIKFEKIGKLIK